MITIPLSALDAGICWWIFLSLARTIQTLELRRNDAKLALYLKFRNVLAVCVAGECFVLFFVLFCFVFVFCFFVLFFWLRLCCFQFYLFLAGIEPTYTHTPYTHTIHTHHTHTPHTHTIQHHQQLRWCLQPGTCTTTAAAANPTGRTTGGARASGSCCSSSSLSLS